MTMMLKRWVYDDGGRKRAGYRGEGPCVVRAIAIATEKPYREVYEALRAATCSCAIMAFYTPSLANHFRAESRNGFKPDEGSPPAVFRPYLVSLGWLHTPITNRKIYLRANQLPSGRIIVEVRNHLVAVIDGVIHDTYNSGMNGRRPVTDYYTKAQ
jgi:hypothetical protein